MVTCLSFGPASKPRRTVWSPQRGPRLPQLAACSQQGSKPAQLENNLLSRANARSKLALNEWPWRATNNSAVKNGLVMGAQLGAPPRCVRWHACMGVKSAAGTKGGGEGSEHGAQNWAGRAAAMCRAGSFAVGWIVAWQRALRVLLPAPLLRLLRPLHRSIHSGCCGSCLLRLLHLLDGGDEQLRPLSIRIVICRVADREAPVMHTQACSAVGGFWCSACHPTPAAAPRRQAGGQGLHGLQARGQPGCPTIHGCRAGSGCQAAQGGQSEGGRQRGRAHPPAARLPAQMWRG